MDNIFDLLAAVIVAIVVSVLIIDGARTRLKNKKLVVALAQSEIDKMAVKSQLDQTIKEYNLVQSEGFIKFLSESRDAAFEYIESAQEIIKDLSSKADYLFIEFADSETKAAYRKLKELLPNNPK